MTKEELTPGQWYQINDENWFYKLRGIKDTGVVLEEYIYRKYLPEKGGTLATNSQFWEQAVPIGYSEVEKFLPEELKQKNYELFLI